MAIEDIRSRLVAALAKPLPDNSDWIDVAAFNPWGDIISGIHGSYSSESDYLMISALESVRDRKIFEFIESRGFAAEFALYVLSGHGLINYGVSPRAGWPDEAISDLWDTLIEKWKAYADIVWKK